MNLHEKILADIEKTGFLHELKVGSLLRKRGWSTHHSETYLDRDLQKSREIDIIATKSMYDSIANLHFEFNLVIDAKKMEKRPWVVFAVDKKRAALGWRILHFGYNDRSTHNRSFFSGILNSESLSINNFKDNQERYGIAFHEAFKESEEGTKTYDSLISVCKAAWHYIELYKPEEVKEFNPLESTEIHIYIPLIVLEGKLFEVHLDKEGEMILSEEQFIQVQLNYSSPGYKKSGIDFFPDIILTSFLDKYLDKTELWIESMFKDFSKTLIDKYKK